MRILYHSAPPTKNTGYGRCTREIVSRIHGNGHEILLHPMNEFESGPLTWHGEDMERDLKEPIKILNTEGPFGLGNVIDNFEKYDCDFYFTHFDTWMGVASENIPKFDIPYGSYVILDHDPVPKKVTNQIMNSQMSFSMSKWAKKKLEEDGVLTKYIPHGVDTERYRPLGWGDGEEYPDVKFKKDSGDVEEIDLENTFVVGMVAANHGDRKRIPIQMEAFKRFVNEVDEDALLYVHTDVNPDRGHNLEQVREEMGLSKDRIMWADQEKYHNIDDEEMNMWYNTFDVMMNCSQGESWGLTLTESMAAGTPVIATNFSSMPEQLGVDVDNPKASTIPIDGSDNVHEADHGLVVDPSVGIWRERVSSKQMVVSPDSVFEALKYYRNNLDVLDRHSKRCREFVKENYSWDENVAQRFKSAFDSIEKGL